MTMHAVAPSKGNASFEETYKEVQNRIQKLKEQVESIYALPPLKMNKQLPRLALDTKDLMDFVELIGEEDTFNSLVGIKAKIEQLIADLKDGTITKVNVLRSKLKKIAVLISEIELDKNNAKVNESFVQKSSIQPIKLKVPANDPPAFMMRGPLAILTPQAGNNSKIDKPTQKRLQDLLGAENVGGLFVIKQAIFLVANIEKLHNAQPKLKIEEIINGIVTVIGSKAGLSPIHDISMKIGKYQIVWLIPQNAARGVDALLDAKKKFQIYIKV